MLTVWHNGASGTGPVARKSIPSVPECDDILKYLEHGLTKDLTLVWVKPYVCVYIYIYICIYVCVCVCSCMHLFTKALGCCMMAGATALSCSNLAISLPKLQQKQQTKKQPTTVSWMVLLVLIIETIFAIQRQLDCACLVLL